MTTRRPRAKNNQSSWITMTAWCQPLYTIIIITLELNVWQLSRNMIGCLVWFQQKCVSLANLSWNPTLHTTWLSLSHCKDLVHSLTSQVTMPSLSTTTYILAQNQLNLCSGPMVWWLVITPAQWFEPRLGRLRLSNLALINWSVPARSEIKTVGGSWVGRSCFCFLCYRSP